MLSDEKNRFARTNSDEVEIPLYAMGIYAQVPGKITDKTLLATSREKSQVLVIFSCDMEV